MSYFLIGATETRICTKSTRRFLTTTTDNVKDTNNNDGLLTTTTDKVIDRKGTYEFLITTPYKVIDKKSIEGLLTTTPDKVKDTINTPSLLTINTEKGRLNGCFKWFKLQTNQPIFNKFKCFLSKRYIISIFIILYLSLIILIIILAGEKHKASFLDFLLKIFKCIIKCIEIFGDRFLENDYFLDSY